MEDDRIKNLFQNFDPDLSSDSLFMSRLQKNMHSVELVKRHSAEQRRRNRVAVIAAAVAGLFSGVLMTLIFPVLSRALATVDFSIPLPGFTVMTLDWSIVTWLIAGAACVMTSLSVYDIALACLTLHKRH